MTIGELKQQMIERLLPVVKYTPAELENRYPQRALPEGAIVTRLAPSPTGIVHIGTIFAALVCAKLAHQSQGVFFLRIEDTDKLREVPGAVTRILTALQDFQITVDEGLKEMNKEQGQYGPYLQSQRAEIYKTYVKFLLENDAAYPCFCSAAELEEMNRTQKLSKARPGYYGRWAQWRDRPIEDVFKALDAGKAFVIRYRSCGCFDQKVLVRDCIKGDLELADNDQDIVILKSEGLPTYHFAHAVDDHLMRTTHVIRGEEWVPSVPLHQQLFRALGWNPPQYAHFAPIYKMEGTSKRKLSKRHDPEADIEFYQKEGYPVQALIEYLFNLAHSGFEDWRKEHRDVPLEAFQITFESLSKSAGPLLDCRKIQDISCNVISQMTAPETVDLALAWAQQYDPVLAREMNQDLDYTQRIFGIEKNTDRVRKDITKWSDLRDEVGCFFDALFESSLSCIEKLLPAMDIQEINKIVSDFLAVYDPHHSKEIWLDQLREIARQNGYAESLKLFKQNKEQYKGYLADIANVLRVLLTGRTRSPDLYQIMNVMGEERVKQRLSQVK